MHQQGDSQSCQQPATETDGNCRSRIFFCKGGRITIFACKPVRCAIMFILPGSFLDHIRQLIRFITHM